MVYATFHVASGGTEVVTVKILLEQLDQKHPGSFLDQNFALGSWFKLEVEKARGLRLGF